MLVIMTVNKVNMFDSQISYTMASASLKICTYNVQGIQNCNWDYLQNTVANHDFVLIQEHWLFNNQAHVVTDNLSNANMVFVSGMSDTEFISGRPYGGCAIVWKNNIPCSIEPIQCPTTRLCGAKCVFKDITFLLFTVYMPCDTEFDRRNTILFDEVLHACIPLHKFPA